MSVSGATWSDTAGIGGWHLDYDGTDDNTSVTDTAFSADTYTMMAWFKPDEADGNSGNAIATVNSNGNAGMNIVWELNTANQFGVFFNNANSGSNLFLDTNKSVSVGEWVFVAGVADFASNNAVVYSGLASDSGISTGDSGTYDNTGDMGSVETINVGDNGGFDGGIDAPQYGIDQALSQSEVDSFFQDSKEFYQ